MSLIDKSMLYAVFCIIDNDFSVSNSLVTTRRYLVSPYDNKIVFRKSHFAIFQIMFSKRIQFSKQFLAHKLFVLC